MTQQLLAGWYEDLEDPTFQNYRYWDGQTWTEFTSDSLSDIERVGVAGLPTGRYAWAVGFLAWIPIPFVGLLLAALVMAVVYRTGRLKGSALCTENTRRAANWGLTVLTISLMRVVYFIAVANLVPGATQAGFFPLGAVVIVYIVVVLAHTVIAIAGTVVAGRGRAFNPRIAIPFLRG